MPGHQGAVDIRPNLVVFHVAYVAFAGGQTTFTCFYSAPKRLYDISP